MSGARAARPHLGPRSSLILSLSLGMILCTAILHYSGSTAFERYFGRLDPVRVAALAAFLGAVGLVMLDRGGWFSLYRGQDRGPGLRRAAVIATLLAIPAITLDLIVGFPEETNVRWPQAFLFYPAIGYVVEVAFHILPLTILLLPLRRWVREENHQKLIWTCIVLVSVLEPWLQTALGPSDGFPRLATAYVAVHVFVINICQLWVFKRYDFVSMFALRLVYYAWWHVLWGYARLELLF